MARRTTPKDTQKAEPALLCKPRETVRAQLLTRVAMGDEMLGRSISSSAELTALKTDYTKWTDYNTEFLKRAFTSEQFADEYNFWIGIGVMAMRQQSLHELVQETRDRIAEKRNRLVSIIERLDLIDEIPNLAQPQAPAPAQRPQLPSGSNKKVFLVHGQDEEAKAVVARFITSCDLDPIILHEQANGGRTIIEKFEKEADVGFAVVLLTPDDVGGLRKGTELASDNLQARARQNVVLELGYFAGRLGRERVAAIKKGDLELPSDIAGVVWTPMDPADAWKMSLARELKAAGYEFDLGKALSI